MAPPRNRRTKNYWEPFYAPDITMSFDEHTWEFDKDKGPVHSIFNDDSLKKVHTRSSPLKLIQINFNTCDFYGKFDNQIIFEECDFLKCDFGLSTFNKCKFNKCTFRRTSFTQATFYDCEFRDCDFNEIGISGNETILEKTLFTNPSKFINAAFTNTKQLPYKVNPLRQRLRLQESKSTLSRVILNNLTSEGSEEAFYDAIKVNTLQNSKAKLAKTLINILDNSGSLSGIIKLPFFVVRGTAHLVELAVYSAIGEINNWGSSTIRPLTIGTILVFIFSLIYWHIYKIDFLQSIKTSIELMMVFGYTNHVKPNDINSLSMLYLINTLIGIIWYIITAPTIINKITRIK